jgi:HEAT repeat protein
MAVTNTGPAVLDAAALARFVRDGYIIVQTGLPREFHDEVCRHACAILDRDGNWGNNILPRVPELREVLTDPAVDATLASLLGPTYVLHPHRYCHRNEPGSTAQRLHKDTREFSGDRHFRHVRPRWLIAFYYPHDVTAEMGPTGIVPASQYYLEQPDRDAWPERLLYVQGGSVAIVHFGIWHRATSNRGNSPRYMFKFQFARMDEPFAPDRATPTAAGNSSAPAATELGSRVLSSEPSSAPHVALWERTLAWLGGNGDVAVATEVTSDIASLESDDAHTRRAAADAFALTPSAAAIPRLARLLYDEDEPVRLNAAYALAAAGSASLPALDAALLDPSGPARRYAALGLSEMGAAAIDVLAERARDADEQVAINAIDALGNMGGAAAPTEPELRWALRSEHPWVRRHAAEALGLLGPAARPAVSDLSAALGDEHANVRFNVATALARVGPAAAEATPALVDALDDSDRYARGWAAQALRRIGTPEATDALLDRLMLARWCSTSEPNDRY